MKTNRRFLLAAILIATTFTFSCSSDDKDDGGNASSSSRSEATGGSSSSSGGNLTGTNGYFTDSRSDSKSYKWVKIGEQTWMAENLNYNVSGSKCYGEDGSVFVGWTDGGELIKSTLSNAEIQANCAIYGRLYDWATAMTVCPSGWHLPSNAEWITLVDFVGGNFLDDSSNAGTKLKTASGWNEGGNGEDTYGFSALPSGYGDSGDYYDVGDTGRWWSASNDVYNVYNWIMNYREERALMNNRNKEDNLLFSVRCVKN